MVRAPYVGVTLPAVAKRASFAGPGFAPDEPADADANGAPASAEAATTATNAPRDVIFMDNPFVVGDRGCLPRIVGTT
jgi:hypothetical protein